MRSEKGFYGMAFTLSVFAAIAVQKNIRDSQNSKQENITHQLNEQIIN
jgi:hypothetical protein